MASLQGTQINNTYPGLFKTDNNQALGIIPGDVSNISDGNGNVINLQLGINDIKFPGGNVDFTGSTVTGLPGGGAAGLVNAGFTDSMKNADALTTSPATAMGINDIVIGNGAEMTFTSATNDYYGGGSIVIGNGATYSKAVDYSFIPTLGQGIVIGQNAFGRSTDGDAPVAIGRNATSNDAGVSIGNYTNAAGQKSIALSAGQATGPYSVCMNGTSSGYGSIQMGNGGNATGGGFGEGGISIGNYATNSASGSSITIGGSAKINNSSVSGAIVLGRFDASGAAAFNGGIVMGNKSGSFPSGYQANDLITIGTGTSYQGGGSNNTVAIGLVGTLNGADNAVGIGRQFSIQGQRATAVGPNTTAFANATALGDQSTANANGSAALNGATANIADTTTVKELETQTVGGGITMYSPNGTAFKLTVTDAGALLIS